MAARKESEYMTKIGILTFHRASNYGAVLQAYALQTIIASHGVEAKLVNYYCPTVEKDHRPSKLFFKMSLLKAIIHFPIKAKKDSIFQAFCKRKLNMSEPLDNKKLYSLQEKYSLFITGSDQVWNDRLSGLDPAYMLTFAKENQRYSYACSFGFGQFPYRKADIYKQMLTGIQRISLREESGIKMLKEIGIDAQTDLDPTLLMDSRQWESFLVNPPIHCPYILVYTVSGTIHLLDFAKSLEQKTGYQIIYLNNQYNNNDNLKRVRFSSPEEFVGWFANAEYVLTNSFHGTAFSIIFNRKFKVELETKKNFNIRSRDLLLNCGLENGILMSTEDDYIFDNDWERANCLLADMKSKSLEYIHFIIEVAKNMEGALANEPRR